MNNAGYSWQTRALLFLYSNANIAGCALALLGPLLLFAGVIKTGWLFITAGLYGAGYFFAGKPAATQRRIEETLTLDEMRRRLDEVIDTALPHLTEEMKQRLESLRASIAEVLPRLMGSDNGELF